MAPCSTGIWIKARHLIYKTDESLLSANLAEIINCLGGIKKCLMLLLKFRDCFNTLKVNQLNEILTQINYNHKMQQKDSIHRIKHNDNQKRIGFSDIGSECILHITSYLSISEIGESFKNVNTIFAMIGLQEIKKSDSYYIDGHKLIIENEDEMTQKYHTTNTIGFGDRKFLNLSRLFSDLTAKDMFSKCSEKVDIALDDLSIWNYTERRNKTIRPNRKVKLDFNEVMSDKLDEGITDEMRITHTIPTESDDKKFRSIYDRIGNVQARKVKNFIISHNFIPKKHNHNNYLFVCDI